MKPSNFILKIEKPCTVNLSGMVKNDVGLFCTNCEKHVIDFSKLSDEEVISLVEKLNGNFCGRLTKSQLERVFVASKKKQTSPRLNKILAGLFAFGMLESAHVDAKETKENEIVWSDTQSENGGAEINLEKNVISNDTTKNVLRGVVLVKGTEKPIPMAHVQIFGTAYSTQADSAGNFSLSIPDSLVTDSISIRVWADYYTEMTVKISKTELATPKTISLWEEILIEGGMRWEPAPCDNPKKKKKKN